MLRLTIGLCSRRPKKPRFIQANGNRSQNGMDVRQSVGTEWANVTHVFCLKLIAYVYMMRPYGVCIIKVHCVSCHRVTISV